MDGLLTAHNFNEDFIDDTLSPIYKNSIDAHDNECKSIYSEITLKIVNKKIETNLYNKTHTFSFRVNRLQKKNGNRNLN